MSAAPALLTQTCTQAPGLLASLMLAPAPPELLTLTPAAPGLLTQSCTNRGAKEETNSSPRVQSQSRTEEESNDDQRLEAQEEKNADPLAPRRGAQEEINADPRVQSDREEIGGTSAVVYGAPCVFCVSESLLHGRALHSVVAPGVDGQWQEKRQLVCAADSQGRAYILDGSGRGEVLWSVSLPAAIFSSPLVLLGPYGPEMRILVGCRDNFLYCLEVDLSKVASGVPVVGGGASS